MAAGVVLASVIGCGPPEYTIEPLDAPLTLEIRNVGEAPLSVTDQVALWGTIGTGRGRLTVNGRRLRIQPNGTFADVVPLPAEEPARLMLIAANDDSTITRELLVHRATARSAPAADATVPVPSPLSAWVRLHRPPSDTADAPTQARPIYTRWSPDGELAIAIPQETIWPADLRHGAAVRLRLSDATLTWVPAGETIEVAPPSTRQLALGAPAVTHRDAITTVSIPVAMQTASVVEPMHDTLVWTIYRATAPAASIALDDPVLRQLRVDALHAGAVEVRAALRGSILGWRVRHADGAMHLEVRADTLHSIRGLRVAIDAGHPPGGATGPGGLREDVLTLRVARELDRQLEALGAVAILTRQDSLPLSLDARLVRAEAANAQLLISLHADAPGDGRHPASADFTRMHWWHPNAKALAMALVDSVANALGTTADGTVRSNLAMLRVTWFPAVLVEPTTIALPRREAFLASDEGVRRYAEGVIRGIASWVQRTRGDGSLP